MIGISIGVPSNETVVAGAPPPPAFQNLYSLITDGVDEYAELAGASVTGCEFNYNAAFSVSCWMKTQDHVGAAGIIASKMRPAPTWTGWSFGVYGATPFLFFSSNVSTGNYMQVYLDQFVVTGSWKHLCVTYDGSGNAGGVNFYTNGTNVYPSGQTTAIYLDNIASNSTLGGATAPLVLGAQSTTSGYFNGSFDEVSVWSTELNAAEVEALYNPNGGGQGTPTDLALGPTLDAWYRCGEAAGDSATGTIHDVSGNGNNLAAQNMEAGDIQAVTAKPFWNELSCSIDGVDERLYSSPANNCPIFDSTDPFSVSLWMKSSAATWGCMIGKQLNSGGYTGWGIFQNPTAGGKFFVAMFSALGSNTQGVRTQTGGFNDGNWHHVCMTYSGSSTAAGILVYVDGVNEPVDIDSDTLTGSILTGETMSIGSRGSTSPGAFFNGKIDEVSLHSTELTAPEVAEIYNGGVPLNVTLVPAGATTEAYYRMGDSTFDAKASGQPTVYDVTANAYHLWQANIEQGDFVTDTP